MEIFRSNGMIMVYPNRVVEKVIFENEKNQKNTWRKTETRRNRSFQVSDGFQFSSSSFRNMANFLPLHYVNITVHVLQYYIFILLKLERYSVFFLATKMFCCVWVFFKSPCLLTFLTWLWQATLQNCNIWWVFFFSSTSYPEPYLKSITLSSDSSLTNFPSIYINHKLLGSELPLRWPTDAWKWENVERYSGK